MPKPGLVKQRNQMVLYLKGLKSLIYIIKLEKKREVSQPPNDKLISGYRVMEWDAKMKNEINMKRTLQTQNMKGYLFEIICWYQAAQIGQTVVHSVSASLLDNSVRHWVLFLKNRY